MGHLTERLAPDAAEPLSLREIAERAGGSRRDEMIALGDALREEIRAVRRASAVVAAAASSLIRHMSGVMQSVNGALSRVRVYERRGRIDVGTQTNFCVDVTS